MVAIAADTPGEQVRDLFVHLAAMEGEAAGRGAARDAAARQAEASARDAGELRVRVEAVRAAVDECEAERRAVQ